MALLMLKMHIMNSYRRGITIVEVLVVLVAIFVLILLTIRQAGRPPRPYRIQCVSNLKNVGLAFRIYATDNGDQYPYLTAVTNHSELIKLTALHSFLALSNELSTPKIIWCPKDTDRKPADGWTNLASQNISYFVNLSANETNPQVFLSGDRNLTVGGKTFGTGRLSVNTNEKLGWTKDIHEEQGNVTMGDGSVQQFSNSRLKQGFRESGTAMNIFLLP
jgi:competence protein ComGC